MSILTFRPDNVRRVPDWRWQRAGEVVDSGGRIVRRRDDALVREACKFRRLLARCQSDEDRLEALDACPELFEAWTIYDAGEDPIEHRWELEARLLSGQSLEDISLATGTPINVIRCYEQMFFDVLSRLKHASLIIHSVIGQSVQVGLAERDYDVLWKLFGYFAGPHVLEAIMFKFIAPAKVTNATGVRAFMKDFTKDQVFLKSGVAMATMPINWQTRELLMTLWQSMLAMEAQAGQTSVGSELLKTNIQGLVEAFAWTKYRPGVDPALTGKVAELESNGVRLRASELCQIGFGEAATGMEHLFPSARYPKKDGNNENNS